MEVIAAWLLVLAVGCPLAGAIHDVVVDRFAQRFSAFAVLNAKHGIFGSVFASSALVGVMNLQGISKVRIPLGEWLELSRNIPSRCDWILVADQSTACWLMLTSVLAVVLQIVPESDHPRVKPPDNSVATAFALAAGAGFAVSGNLFQLLICWTALGLIVFVMLVQSGTSNSHRILPAYRTAENTTADSSFGYGKFPQLMKYGLWADLALLGAVLLLERGSGSDQISTSISPDGLAQLGKGNPGLPGFAGSLLVLSLLGRTGLFPCFGWHSGAAMWNTRERIAVYSVWSVPSGTWLLIKFQPLLISTETSLILLGSLGALAALAGSFVACGQQRIESVIGYVISSQTALIMLALGSGQSHAVWVGQWHLFFTTGTATCLLLSLKIESLRRARWVAAAALSGLIPLASWAPAEFVEFNLHPMTWLSPIQEVEQGAAHDPAVPVAHRDATIELQPGPPRWACVCGIGIAQGLAAYALAKSLPSGRSEDSSIGNMGSPVLRVNRLESCLAAAVGLMMLLAGMGGCALGLISVPVSPPEWIRLGILQGIVWTGFGLGIHSRSPSDSYETDNSASGTSFSRLCRNGLYMDEVINLAQRPLLLLQAIAQRFLGVGIIERAIEKNGVQLSSLCGAQFEGQDNLRPDFFSAVLWLGTGTLLLTWMLVG